MASIYIGFNRGATDQHPFAITEGATTGSTDFEFRIDTGQSSTRQDAALALETIKQWILDGLADTVLGL